MFIKRLFLILLLSFSCTPLYGIFGIRLVIPWDPWKKEEIDVNSRKYLYEILKHSPNFILTKEVKENREYYIKLIEQHIKVLQEKKNKFNFGQFKHYAIGTLWAAGAAECIRFHVAIKESKNLRDKDKSELIGLSFYLVPICYFATRRFYKAIRYKAKVQQRLERDLHILNLLQQK